MEQIFSPLEFESTIRPWWISKWRFDCIYLNKQQFEIKLVGLFLRHGKLLSWRKVVHCLHCSFTGCVCLVSMTLQSPCTKEKKKKSPCLGSAKMAEGRRIPHWHLPSQISSLHLLLLHLLVVWLVLAKRQINCMYIMLLICTRFYTDSP